MSKRSSVGTDWNILMQRSHIVFHKWQRARSNLAGHLQSVHPSSLLVEFIQNLDLVLDVHEVCWLETIGWCSCLLTSRFSWQCDCLSAPSFWCSCGSADLWDSIFFSQSKAEHREHESTCFILRCRAVFLKPLSSSWRGFHHLQRREWRVVKCVLYRSNGIEPAVRLLVMTHSLPESLVHWNDSSVGVDPSQMIFFQPVSAALLVTLYLARWILPFLKGRAFRDRGRWLLCAVCLLIYLAAIVLLS